MKFGGSSQKNDVLKNVPLFSNLSKKNLDEISRISDEVHRPAETVLAKEGDVGSEFILIVEGEARVEKGGEIINKLPPFSFFGEVSIIDGQPRTASVIADTDVKLLVIHSRYFHELLAKVPELAKETLLALCQYLRKAQRQED